MFMVLCNNRIYILWEVMRTTPLIVWAYRRLWWIWILLKFALESIVIEEGMLAMHALPYITTINTLLNLLSHHFPIKIHLNALKCLDISRKIQLHRLRNKIAWIVGTSQGWVMCHSLPMNWSRILAHLINVSTKKLLVGLLQLLSDMPQLLTLVFGEWVL